MKNLYIVIALVFAASVTSAQNFFFESFDDCELPTNWTNTAVVGDTVWAFGDNTLGSPAGNVDGTCMAYVHDDDLGSGYPAVVMDLVTPVIDLSSLDTALLQFDYVFEDLGSSYFAVALWNGSDWDTVFTENSDPGCFGFFPTCSPRSANIDLSGYLNADFQVKFIFDDGAGWNWYIGLDNVAIYVPPSDDGILTDALSPVSGCGMSATEPISFTVYNNGQDTIQSVSISYSVDGGTAISETFSAEVLSAETDTFNMTLPVDLSTPGTYEFQAWVDVPNDPDQTNDTIWFTVESIPVITGLPYSEDFENGAGGWTSGGTLDPWVLGDPETAFIDTANSGINAWVTNPNGTYQNGTDAYVESPCMDFSSLVVDPVFRFAFITNSETNWDGTWLSISTDAGATWSTVGNVGEGSNWYTNEDEHGANFDEDWWDAPFGGANEWFIAQHLLDGAAGSSSVKLRVFFHSDGSINAGYEGFAFDDIEIFEQPSLNAGVVEIITPVTGCGLGLETVSVVIENFGDTNIVNFPVEFNAGMGVVTELFTDTLFAASTDTFTFSTGLDLSAPGDYNFGAWTALLNDGDMLNDSMFSLITSAPVVSSLPYFTDFESGADGWYSTTGNLGIWELGDPEGTLIDTAHSGINAWATNLNTLNYVNNQLSYLISPCFDFSGLVIDPIIEFAYISNAEVGWDGMWLEVSTDAGVTWTTLGSVGEGENWYNNENEHGANFDEDWWDGTTNDWIYAEHLIDGVAGESDVMLRFVFDSDGSINTYEGFAVDDVSIIEQPAVNGELTSIFSPQSNCGLTATEDITVIVNNIGSLQMDSIIVSYSFDGGTAVTEVFNQVIAIGGSATVTLASTVDLSTSGDYDLTVWVTTIGDGDPTNDTIATVITSIPTVSTIPYFEDFENGTGGWLSLGFNGEWELGDPEGTLIDTAYSGVNAWATNLNAPQYNNNQSSWLFSPCLDFSGLAADPIISFAFISESEIGWDGMWMEVTTDGGASWTTLGAVGEGENWYTNEDEHGANFDEDWWDGNSGGNVSWIIAEHILTGTAGFGDVRVRFTFDSDASINIGYEGFAVDDISIHPQPELDLAVISLDGPEDGCSLDQEEVTFTFWNKGLQTVSNFEVGFIVDGGAAQTETYTGSIAQNDTVTYTFLSEFADASVPGLHIIDVFTGLAGDENMDNDSLFGGTVFNNGSSTPLSQSEQPGTFISSALLPEGTSSQMFFCGLPPNLDGCLELAYVTIDSIQHTWLSDLTLLLVSPAGDTVELSSGNGGSADDMSDVVFTDESQNDITLQTVDIMPGEYHTEDPLGFAQLYNGQNPNGAWTLVVLDLVGGDTGTLIEWSMTFVDGNPEPTLNYSDTTICLTQVLTVSIPETYDSYLWSTGDNDQTVQLNGSVLGLGQHEISVIVDNDGCTGETGSFILTVDACAGIEEFANGNIQVYPNPSKGEIILEVNGETSEFELNVLDVNGKLVYAEHVDQTINRYRKSIDLTSLAKGMYFLHLNDGTESVTEKLIIQ